MRTCRTRAAGTAVALLLAASALTACGDDGNGAGDGAPPELEIAVGGAADQVTVPDDNPIKEALEEQVGATITSVRTPENLAAMLAAGDAPDFFRLNRTQLDLYASQGLLLDLTPYRDRLQEYIDFVGEDVFELGVIDGKPQAVVRKPAPASYVTYWIRADWLATLGLALPTTVEDFEQVLQAFTTGDPDGNGSADTYGLTGSSTAFNPFAPLWGSFGTAGPGRFYVEDGAVVNGYTDPDTPAAVEYVQRLVGSGVVDPDSFSIDFNEARDRAFQGRAGVMAAGWDAMKKQEFVDAAAAAQPGADWQQLPVMSGPAGDGYITLDPYGASFFAVPASVGEDEAKVDALIDLLNYVSTDEGNRLVSFGVEGTHYTADGDTLAALPALDEDGGYFFVYQLTGRDEETYLEVKFPDEKPFIDVAAAQPLTLVYDSLVVPPEGYTASDAERYATEQLVQFLTGAKSLADYDAFVDELTGQFRYAELIDAGAAQLDELGLTD
ncbi:extracellular solute-binding protein [Jiangella alba]|uniref:Putative aldouronate transport system substrate-binding protein n=1 Tax=Jiangella alba TaxID=561176 RepID=A0A1H5PWN0_9ACTN|nr:extracellular solute-binding protein [Jiangella alba]SEF18109.1 putative aldouronate transport system substrate-binding protein [Jiangella alba]